MISILNLEELLIVENYLFSIYINYFSQITNKDWNETLPVKHAFTETK